MSRSGGDGDSTRANHVQPVPVRLPFEVDVRDGSGLAGPDVVDQPQASARRQLERGIVARSGGRSDRQRRDVLVEFQRARRRGVAVLEVVPRPALSQSPTVERAGVSNDVPLDAADAGRFERRRPFVEEDSGAILSRVDRRVAAAADDEVALQRAALDRRGGLESCLEPVVPPQDFRRGRERHDLHVRRRHQERAGIQGVESLPGVERPDRDSPESLFHDRRAENPVEIGGQGALGPRICSWRGCRWDVGASCRNQQACSYRTGRGSHYLSASIALMIPSSAVVSIFAAAASPSRRA